MLSREDFYLIARLIKLSKEEKEIDILRVYEEIKKEYTGILNKECGIDVD